MIDGEVDGGRLVRFWNLALLITAEAALATFRNENHELRFEVLLPVLCVNFDENTILSLHDFTWDPAIQIVQLNTQTCAVRARSHNCSSDRLKSVPCSSGGCNRHLPPILSLCGAGLILERNIL